MGKCNVIITYIYGQNDERGSTTCISSLLENIPDINGSQWPLTMTNSLFRVFTAAICWCWAALYRGKSSAIFLVFQENLLWTKYSECNLCKWESCWLGWGPIIEWFAGSSHIGASGTTTIVVLRKSSDVAPRGQVSAFSSDIDNGGVSHLIKDSYLFNNLCVAPRQRRQGDVALFIKPSLQSQQCVLLRNALSCLASEQVWRFMRLCLQQGCTHACQHIFNPPYPHRCSFQEHSLLTCQYTVASAFFCATAVLLLGLCPSLQVRTPLGQVSLQHFSVFVSCQ